MLACFLAWSVSKSTFAVVKLAATPPPVRVFELKVLLASHVDACTPRLTVLYVSGPTVVRSGSSYRWLDIKGVAYVINFDCPTTGEGYVHRIGRTGRAGKTGTADTFVTADDRRVAPELVKVLKGSGQPVPAELAQLAAEAKAESWYRPNSRYQ